MPLVPQLLSVDKSWRKQTRDLWAPGSAGVPPVQEAARMAVLPGCVHGLLIGMALRGSSRSIHIPIQVSTAYGHRLGLHAAFLRRGQGLRGRPQQAHAEIGAAVARVGEDARHHPAIPGAAGPAPTSDHAVRTRRRALRIYHSLCSIGSIPVLCPFPDIAMHIIQAPGIELMLSYGVRRAPSGVLVIPGILV
jgi:hypothetical protein